MNETTGNPACPWCADYRAIVGTDCVCVDPCGSRNCTWVAEYVWTAETDEATEQPDTSASTRRNHAAINAIADALPDLAPTEAERIGLAVLAAALPLHETAHADSLRIACQERTHFELETFKLREQLADTERRFDALVTSDKAKQGAADWMLNRLQNDKLIDKETYKSLCGLLRDQIDATRHMTHSEDWGPLTDRYRAAEVRARTAEASVASLVEQCEYWKTRAKTAAAALRTADLNVPEWPQGTDALL